MKRGRLNLRKALVAFSLLVIASPFIYHWGKIEEIKVTLYLLDAKPDQTTPQETKDQVDFLVSTAPESLPYIIEEVKRGPGRHMRIFYCGEILKRIGKPAHQALIEAAKEVKLPEGRFQCAFFLQDLFNDYQCFDVCIAGLIDPQTRAYRRRGFVDELRSQLWHKFPDAPDFLLDSDGQGELTCNMTPEFRDWLIVHTRPKGSLPKVHLPKA